tara:strand:+ start:543 stop:806 length:264 start_codon:yes stop_codon:yes gene_type:complete
VADDKTIEIQENYRFFQTVVRDLMIEHENEFALLHNQSIVDTFQKPIDAMIAGMKKFTDGNFSVQKITDRPVDLGFLSNASNNGIVA